MAHYAHSCFPRGLQNNIRSCIDSVAYREAYVPQQNLPSSHKALETRDRMAENPYDHVKSNVWFPLNLPELIPCAVVEKEVNKHQLKHKILSDRRKKQLNGRHR